MIGLCSELELFRLWRENSIFVSEVVHYAQQMELTFIPRKECLQSAVLQVLTVIRGKWEIAEGCKILQLQAKDIPLGKT